ncbi:hypothetical protein ANCDUO_10832 [Ancylostoma duodenale]|uniref:Uncharacterized protein n=1 Tax=Ancylostoma duodenale TaxID=51022 RepID=A0A0C2GJC6_9BILA|nr:hypothetical protein ANCDUO_10832 [Ancylostoma duodenale]
MASSRRPSLAPAGLLSRFQKFIADNGTMHTIVTELYAYKSITTDVWKQELYTFFADKKNILDSIDWNKWLHEPGMPPKPK